MSRFVVIDTMELSERLRLLLISAGSIIGLIMLTVLPTSIPVISIIQSYYEIGEAGIESVMPMIISAALGLFSMLPWVFLPREHARHRA
jgi:ATP/ADP translocase